MFWSYFNVVFSVSFSHTLSGDIDSAVEGLEALYTQISDTPQKSIAFVFRKVLEANSGDALDKCKTCNFSHLEDTVACELWKCSDLFFFNCGITVPIALLLTVQNLHMAEIIMLLQIRDVLIPCAMF